MKKWFVGFSIVLLLGGCAGLSNLPDRASTDRTVDHFLNDLQKEQWPDAYDYFAPRLKDRVSVEQFSDLMLALKKNFGDLEDFESVVKIFKFVSEGYPFPDIQDEDIRRYTYELNYGAEHVYIYLTVIKEDNEQRIGWFAIAGNDVDTHSEVKDKYSILKL